VGGAAVRRTADPAGADADRLPGGIKVVRPAGDHRRRHQDPLEKKAIDTAWCLGVLCTVEDKTGLLAELHRVLTPQASLGLLVVVAQDNQIAKGPEGNHFPTQRDLTTLLDHTGFTLLEQTTRPDAAPLSWSRRVEEVSAAVAARHRATPAYELAARQSERLTRLFSSGRLSMQLLHAVRRPR
jgi:SAM-dependent methyltransferase